MTSVWLFSLVTELCCTFAFPLCKIAHGRMHHASCCVETFTPLLSSSSGSYFHWLSLSLASHQLTVLSIGNKQVVCIIFTNRHPAVLCCWGCFLSNLIFLIGSVFEHVLIRIWLVFEDEVVLTRAGYVPLGRILKRPKLISPVSVKDSTEENKHKNNEELECRVLSWWLPTYIKKNFTFYWKNWSFV